MFQLTDEIAVIIVVAIIVVIYAISKCRMSCGSKSKEGIIYPYFEPGHRPATGDFLPTVGEVPSHGGYVDESAAYDDNVYPTVDTTGWNDMIDHMINRAKWQRWVYNRMGYGGLLL